VELLTISVIIPTLNEAGEIGPTLVAIRGARAVERIVVDGASEDETTVIARREGARVLESPRGRARQMNTGAADARGEILLFLHADTRLPPGFDRAVRESVGRPGFAAGAFRLTIDSPSRSLRVIETVADWRARRLRMPYGDQALFTTAEMFRAVGGYPDLPLMEDFELVRALRRRGRITILDQPVRTSGRRWQRVGPWRNTLINQLAIVAYRVGVSPARIASWCGRR
jgi:rSAM/selenodomain-associated transferase 2